MTEPNYNLDEQTIDNAEEIINWLQTHRQNVVTPGATHNGHNLGSVIAEDMLRCFDVDHALKAESVRFDADAGTLSIELWNPSWFEAETVDEHYTNCTENSPDGYHMHVELPQ